jgi:hypothetical protein
MSRRNRFVRGLALQLALLVGTLAAAELILRVIDLRELRDGYSVGSTVVFQYDMELGWRSIPNTVAQYRGLRPITIRTNSLGLRDIEHGHTPRPTVLFLGDSFVWGYDVEQNERFTEILRDEFPRIRMVNAGVSGYGTDQEYLLLRSIWNSYKPDVVVLILCAENDRYDNETNLTSNGYYKPYLEQTSVGQWRFAGHPIPKSRHSYFIENPFVRNLWLARAAVTGYVYLRYPKVMLPDPTEHLIGMLRDFVQSHGAKFLVGVQYSDPRDAAVPQAQAVLQAQNVPYTSIGDAESYQVDGNHWTPKGHRLVADRLRSLLMTNAGFSPADFAGRSGKE